MTELEGYPMSLRFEPSQPLDGDIAQLVRLGPVHQILWRVAAWFVDRSDSYESLPADTEQWSRSFGGQRSRFLKQPNNRQICLGPRDRFLSATSEIRQWIVFLRVACRQALDLLVIDHWIFASFEECLTQFGIPPE